MLLFELAVTTSRSGDGTVQCQDSSPAHLTLVHGPHGSQDLPNRLSRTAMTHPVFCTHRPTVRGSFCAWHGRVLPQVDRWSEKTQTQRRQPRWHSWPWWLFCMSCPVHLCPHRRCHFKHFAFCSWQTCPTYLKRRHQRHQRHRRMEHSLLAGESRSKKCERSGSGTFVTAD